MIPYVYDARGNAVGFVRGRFIHTMEGAAVGQLSGTRVHKMSGQYVGELFDCMVVDQYRGDYSSIGRFDNHASAGRPVKPGSRGYRGGPHADVFNALLS
jgi:hypothetical protein